VHRLVGRGHGRRTVDSVPNGSTMLIDAGDDGKGNKVVVPYLQSLGIKHLDYTVVSHFHSDHMGGMDEVLKVIPATHCMDHGTTSQSTDSYHGSQYSSNPTFLAAVKPEVGIISCGDRNNYGLPEVHALGRLEDTHMQIYQTNPCDNHDGTEIIAEKGIYLDTDGQTYKVTIFRKKLCERRIRI